ncbi:MAG: hypothetical protein HY074_16600 [Deltaproteobacteria bacterium]|nr:hypothetical protein [Deltaproteobacteria bacterium]
MADRFWLLALSSGLIFPVLSFAGMVTGKVVDDGGNGVEAVIYADAANGEVSKAPPVAEMRQKDKAFVPRVLAVEVGQTVRFPNEDFVFHNAFSASKGNAFDLGLFKGNAKYNETTLSKIEKGPEAGVVKFKAPGRVDVFCNIHTSMSGVIVVLPHSYHTRSKPDGSFTLKTPASGAYKIHAMDDSGNEAVIAAPAGAGSVKITFKERRTTVPEHLNKEGKPYKPGDPNY